MYQIFEITSNVDGEQVRENALITGPESGDLFSVLNKLCLSLEGLKTYRHNGLTYNGILSCLPLEILALYGMKIVWLDCVVILSKSSIAILRETIWRL